MRPTPTVGIMALVLVLGFISMGFQLVGSRLLAPYFGTTIIVWAFLISTFLAAYSLGSFLGGWLSGRDRSRWPMSLLSLSIGATVGLAIVAFAGKPILDVLDARFEDFVKAVAVSCFILFILPVASISALLPFCIQKLAHGGMKPGYASGLVYSVSTLGNIAGVLTTALVLIPNAGLRTLLTVWFAVGSLSVILLQILIQANRDTPRP